MIVTDTVPPHLLEKVKAWRCTVEVLSMGGGLYIARSTYRSAHGSTANRAVEQWLLDMAIDAVNAQNLNNLIGNVSTTYALGDFFRQHPQFSMSQEQSCA